VSEKRIPSDSSPQLIEALHIGDDGYVLFVGRASVWLERAEAEAVIVSLTSALARTPEAQENLVVPAETN
jgi:hypothetical protein